LIRQPPALPLRPQIKGEANPALLASHPDWFVLSCGVHWAAPSRHRGVELGTARGHAAPDHAVGAWGAEHPRESQAGGFAWLFLGA